MKKINNAETNKLYNKKSTLRVLNATYNRYNEYIKVEEIKYNNFVETLKKYKADVISKKNIEDSIKTYLINIKKIIKVKQLEKANLESQIILEKENISTSSNLKIIIIKQDINKINKEINYYLEKEKELTSRIEKNSKEIEYSRKKLSEKLIDFEYIHSKRKKIIKKQEDTYKKIQEISKEIEILNNAA